MSKKLLQQLNGANNGSFQKFINQNQQKEVNITWYPSANTDFRAMLYCSESYINKHAPELQSLSNTDLFIYTDYNPSRTENNALFLENEILFSDQHTRIRVIEREILPPLKNWGIFNEIKGIGTSQIDLQIVNQVYFLTLEINSDELGSYEVHLLYAITYNEYFFKTVLLPTRAEIHQLIRVRHGGGFGGGGKSNGFWLNFVLETLKVHCLITEDVQTPQDGDLFFMEKILKLNFKIKIPQPIYKKIKTMPEKLWSNHGEISWYVKSEDNTKPTSSTDLLPIKFQFNTPTSAKLCSAKLKDDIRFRACWYFLNHIENPRNKQSDKKKIMCQSICNDLMNERGFDPNKPFDNLQFMDLVFLFELFGYKLCCRNPYYKSGVVAYDARIVKITFKDPANNLRFDLFNRMKFNTLY
jgi:hypothetical protein